MWGGGGMIPRRFKRSCISRGRDLQVNLRSHYLAEVQHALRQSPPTAPSTDITGCAAKKSTRDAGNCPYVLR